MGNQQRGGRQLQGIFCGSVLALAVLFCGISQAQPPDAPFVPSEELTRDIASSVVALTEATDNDDGYKAVRTVVAGSSDDARLARAWREWRRLALANDSRLVNPRFSFAIPPVGKRLVFRGVEVEDMQRARDVGEVSVAHVKVNLDVMTISPALPVKQWPADPWQGEFTLQKSQEADAHWQFVSAHRVGTDDTFIPLSQRGGDWLEQAIKVICHPQAMLRTTRLFADEESLRVLVDAIQRYIGQTGYYPPSRYFSALLGGEVEASRPVLRRAFRVAGTTRAWTLNSALAGRRATEAQAAPPKWLLWDGTPRHAFFTLGGNTVVAFTDGRIAPVSAQDLQ